MGSVEERTGGTGGFVVERQSNGKGRKRHQERKVSMARDTTACRSTRIAGSVQHDALFFFSVDFEMALYRVELCWTHRAESEALLELPLPLRLILMVKEHEGTAGATSACTVELIPRFSKAPFISPHGKFNTVAAARRVDSSLAVKGASHRNLASRRTNTPWLFVWSLSICFLNISIQNSLQMNFMTFTSNDSAASTRPCAIDSAKR